MGSLTYFHLFIWYNFENHWKFFCWRDPKIVFHKFLKKKKKKISEFIGWENEITRSLGTGRIGSPTFDEWRLRFYEAEVNKPRLIDHSWWDLINLIDGLKSTMKILKTHSIMLTQVQSICKWKKKRKKCGRRDLVTRTANKKEREEQRLTAHSVLRCAIQPTTLVPTLVDITVFHTPAARCHSTRS